VKLPSTTRAQTANPNLMRNAILKFLILELHTVFILAIPVFHFPAWLPNVTLMSIGFFGTQALVLLWVRKPALTIRHIRREKVIARIGLYAIIPVCVFVFLYSQSLQTAHPNVAPASFAAAYITMWWAAPVAIFIRDLGKYRIPYYESHCTKCLYDLSAVEADTCPECNTPFTHLAEPTT
jgi:hypothetical protein